MSTTLDELLRSKWLNAWKLYWLVTAPISLVMVLTMTRLDLSRAEAVSSMIQLSVRCAVPLLFLVFAISTFQVLFPGSLSRWLIRNRKYIGLCFATAMGWQGFFILWLVGIHTEYYVSEVYVLTDAVEGVLGYSFLLAMVLTSFDFGRRRLTPKQWKLLHRSAIYWLWFYAWSTYWFSLFYYEGSPVPLDYIYYWVGLTAWVLRLAAWSKKRMKQTTVREPA